MLLRRTQRFKKSYKKLSEEDRSRADKALLLLSENIGHPGLHVKKIQGCEDIYEARASDALRFTFQKEEDTIVLRVIGRHDEVLKKP